MTLINTGKLDSRNSALTAGEVLQVYCGLDCCLTLEILEEITALHSPPPIYGFELALQAPFLDIMRRGFRADQTARFQAASECRTAMAVLDEILQEFSHAAWGRGLNPRSPAQLKDFFYGAMRVPEVWISAKGERKVSTSREALEKIDVYLYARPFVQLILAIRELGKQLNFFEVGIDPDLRFRTSYNIGGTESGRLSSSQTPFGTGGNAQNISPSWRYVLVSDPGHKMAVIDLEQVEARDVGFFCGCLFDDWTFLDSCESGDLHTNNAKLVWPELPWTGIPAEDRRVADGSFYRDFSYRDMSKRGGHLTNYYGTPFTMARHLKIPVEVAETFQARYVRGGLDSSGRAITPAFPAIERWWRWTATELQTNGFLVTPFGRKRHFFGRPNDDTTLREAIAFLPSGTTADRTNLGVWRLWKHMPEIQLLAQTHDSVTFQYPESLDEDSIIKKALGLIRVLLVAGNGREYVVPGEAKIGWNWGNEVTAQDQASAKAAGKRIPRLNSLGLRKWKPGLGDDRSRPSDLLKRIMS